jgi:hypothetical protein
VLLGFCVAPDVPISRVKRKPMYHHLCPFIMSILQTPPHYPTLPHSHDDNYPSINHRRTSTFLKQCLVPAERHPLFSTKNSNLPVALIPGTAWSSQIPDVKLRQRIYLFPLRAPESFQHLVLHLGGGAMRGRANLRVDRY